MDSVDVCGVLRMLSLVSTGSKQACQPAQQASPATIHSLLSLPLRQAFIWWHVQGVQKDTKQVSAWACPLAAQPLCVATCWRKPKPREPSLPALLKLSEALSRTASVNSLSCKARVTSRFLVSMPCRTTTCTA